MRRTVRITVGTTASLAVLGTVAVLLDLALLAQWQVVSAPGPASLAEALTLVVVAVATVLCAWLALSTVTAVVAHLPGRLGDAAGRWARAWAPAVSRRVATVLVGAVVGGALAPGTALGDGRAVVSRTGPELAPGFTTTSPQHVAGHVSADKKSHVRGRVAAAARTGGQLGPGFALTLPTPAGSGSATAPAAEPGPALASSAPTPAPTPAPGWTPSRPVQRPGPDAGLVTRGSASHRMTDVVVHRGDTLWDIARRHLGPDATDSEVAHAWPLWHAANRALIGDDPGLILPGQILRPPTAASLEAQPSGRAR